MKYLLLFIIFIAISYFSLIAVYHFASDKSSFLTLDIFSKQLFIKITLLLLAYYAADVLRFYFTLKAINVHVPIRFIIYLTFINIFVSSITPLATGGGFAQVYFLNRKGVPIGAASAGSSIRTALPILFFITATPLILIFDKNIDRLFPNRGTWIYAGVMLTMSILSIFTIYKLLKNPYNTIYALKKFINFFNKEKKDKLHKLLDKLSDEIKRFSEHFAMYFSGSKKYVFLSILFTLLFLFTLFLFPVLLIKDLNPSAPVLGIILSQIVITTVMYFAPTPGASGIAEAAFILLFLGYVTQGNIVSLTFAWRLFTVYLGIGLGMLVFYIQLFCNREKKQLNR